ncbi:MAG: hypothetical protein C5B50_23750 [Verrucomicrobia bacterium]|nr:MAG: hypothetical protein C5B50_23750 [Verrucomicrobiota bacterium]
MSYPGTGASKILGGFSLLLSVSAFLVATLEGSTLRANCSAPPSGLVGWWQGENSTLDSAAGNNGVWIGNPGYGPGKVGQGFVFDGLGSYVVLDNTPNLQTQTFTIEAWVRRADPTFATRGGAPGGSMFGYGAGGYNFGMYNDGRLSLTQTGSSDVQTDSLVSDTNFHHLAVTKTGSVVVFYVDGVAYPADPYDPGFIFSTPPAIGSGQDPSYSFWGTIDEVSFYNRALSAAEIQTIYNAGSSGKCMAPYVTIQPVNQTNSATTTATFSVVAGGSQPSSYQWIFGRDKILRGATQNPLVLTNIQFVEAGPYSVVISNSAGSTRSSNAVLKILPLALPRIHLQPTNQTVIAGGTAYLSVKATGSPAPDYQWRLNGRALAGATNSVLVLPHVSASQAGTYTVLVHNHAGSLLSSRAALRMLRTRCAAPPAGLVSWWQAEGNATDLAGGNDGTLVGSVAYGPGMANQGFVSDGTYVSCVQLANAPALQVQSFTIEAWVKRADSTVATADGGSGGNLFGYGGGGYDFGMFNSGQLVLNQGGQGGVQTTAPLVTDTNFHHLAVTKTGTNVVFYVDGAPYPVGPYDPGFTFSSTPAIGALGTDGGASFWGTIDELSFYNRALSAGEVQSIYTAGSYGKCPTISPAITAEPVGRTVFTGASVYLNVAPSGAEPLTYLWKFNGAPLPMQTNLSLLLTNIQIAQAGLYSVLVSNSFGSILSSSAVLTVHAPTHCPPPLPGIVGWWPGASNALDIVGGNHGATAGGVSYAPGMVNQGFNLDGNGSYIQLPNALAFQVQSFTIEAWVQRASASVANNSGAGGGNIFGYSYGGYNLGIYDDGRLSLAKAANGDIQTTPLITDTNFHHLAVTKTNATVIFYVDGVAYPVAPFDPGFTFASTPVIGALGTDMGASFWGIIDEVSFYNRPLSADEIHSIYAAGGNGKCSSLAIISEPANQTVAAGSTAYFAVTAVTDPPAAYQWKFNGSALAGATNSILTIPNTALEQLGSYSVLLTNAQGSVRSSNAVLSLLQTNCAPPVPGMVAWWQAEGNVIDVVAGNNGALAGGVTYGHGMIYSGFVLDGNHGSYVQLANSPVLQAQSFTIEAWVKRADASLATAAGNPGGLIFGYGPGGYTFVLYNDGTLGLSKVGVDQVTTAALVTDTNFHHLAVSKSGRTVVFYVDGVAYPAPFYDPGFAFTTTPVIGATLGFAPGQYNFWGTIDELSFYNRGLSATEVQAIYAAGNYGKCLPSAMPTFALQPASEAVPSGATVYLEAVATGDPPPAYQWQFNGTPLPGATNPVLALSPISLNQTGAYSMQITNSHGSALSSNAVLTLLQTNCTPVPSGLVSWWGGESNTLDFARLNDGAPVGGVTYDAGMVGSGFVFGGNGSYVLLSNSPGLQAQSFTIEAWLQRASSSVTTGGGDAGGEIFAYGPGGYAFALYNGGSLSLSKVGASEVTTASLVTDTNFHHLAVTKSGTEVVFYVDGVAYPAPPYDPGFTFSTTPAIGAAVGYFGGQYSFWGIIDEIAFYNRALSADEVFSLYAAGNFGKCPLSLPPAILTQPVGQAISVGNSANLTVSASGSSPLSYQWSRNGVPLPGATSSSLTLSNILLNQAGSYSVTVTNVFGAVLSSNALVQVSHPFLYDPALAFSIFSNPAGVWSYGFSATLGSPFNFCAAPLRVLGAEVWQTSLYGGPPSVWFNGTTGVVMVGTMIFRPGGLGLQPGPNGEDSILRFTAPSAGIYEVLAAYFGIDTIGTSTDVHVLTNGVSAFDGAVNGSGPGSGSTNFSIFSLKAGDSVDFAVGVGPDGSFYADATGLSVQIGINHPPTASNLRLATWQNLAANIPISRLLASCTDPDGDAVTFNGVSETSTNGGKVVLDANAIIYTPQPNYIGLDRFTYTEADDHGGSTSAYVLVTVAASNQETATMLPPIVIPGGYQIGFLALHGVTYNLQRASSISGPWTTLAAVTTDSNGLGIYVETNGPAGSAFYRTIYP